MNNLFRKRIPLIAFILIIVILTFSGCSFIWVENKFMPNVDESKWKKVSVYEHYYNLNAPSNRFVFQYTNDDFRITIPQYYKKDTTGISIGPWFLPIIPYFFNYFFLEKKKDFNFQFIIENFGDPFTIDIQETKLINSEGQILTPKNVSYIPPEDKYRSTYFSSLGRYWFYYPAEGMKSYSTPVIIETGSSTMFSFDYTNIDRNEELKIELGKISSNKKSLTLPQLIICSGHIIVFCPVTFVGHEPCFITD